MSFPVIARVEQTEPQKRVADPASRVRDLIFQSKLKTRVRPGGKIALGIGSRGITAIPTLAKAAVDALKDLGFDPFIVAAMGSHGGATAEGQRELLAGYGVTSESMGVEVRTQMETRIVGTSPVGLPIYFDANALSADGVVLINRVKPHTDFHAKYESGVLKMLVIGLGKRQGAEQIHKLGLKGLKEVLPAVGEILIDKTPFALGIAVLENADDEPAEIEAMEPEEVLSAEPALLEKARGLMGRLPFDQIDVLIVGELGKNYSGAGLDPNVIGRLMVETQDDFSRPVVTRLAVLDASVESHGNIVGVGFADLVSQKLVDKMDPEPFRINLLTSCFLERARVPITLPHDRDVVQVAIETSWRVDPNHVRLVIVPNTLELKELWASKALEDEVKNHPYLRKTSEFQEIPFDADGELLQESLFPSSVRGRRGRGAAYASH